MLGRLRRGTLTHENRADKEKPIVNCSTRRRMQSRLSGLDKRGDCYAIVMVFGHNTHHGCWLGPNSARRTTPAGIAQLVERNLAKVEVASSRLVSRSRFSQQIV